MNLPNGLDSISFLVTAIAALGALSLGFYNLHKANSERRKRNKALFLFFSIMMKDLSDEEYSKVRKSVLEMIDNIKSMKRIRDVFYFNKDINNHESLDEDNFPISDYMSNLHESDYFIAVISKRVHSSIFYESGYALAKGKKCIIFIKEGIKDILPTIMADYSEISDNVKVVAYKDFEQVIHKFKQMLPSLKA